MGRTEVECCKNVESVRSRHDTARP